MDDTFLLISHEFHVQLFLTYLNAQHPHMTITCESEIDGIVSFLDCTIQRINNGFSTNVFRKPTFTG